MFLHLGFCRFPVHIVCHINSLFYLLTVVYELSVFCFCAVLYQLLVDARVLHADSSAIKLKSIWSRCQALFIRFLEAAIRKTDEVCSICFIFLTFAKFFDGYV